MFFNSCQKPEIFMPFSGDQVSPKFLAFPPHRYGHACSILYAILHHATASATAAAGCHPIARPHHHQPPRRGAFLLPQNQQRHPLLPCLLHYGRTFFLSFCYCYLNFYLSIKPPTNYYFFVNN